VSSFLTAKDQSGCVTLVLTELTKDEVDVDR